MPKKQPATASRTWIVLAIAAATVLVYLPALSAPLVMDDVLGITANPSIQRLSTAFTPPPDLPVSGRPVANVTLAINYAIAGPNGPRNTVGYHLFNLLIHLCAGALLFGVLRRAIRERRVPDDWKAAAEPIAGIVATLWLLHPIQSEAVNYIVQRTESLASLFYLAVLYCSIRAWAAKGNGRLRWYAAAVFACVLGTGSKEIAITAPLAVILYDRAFHFDSWRALRGRLWFYVALVIATLGPFAAFAAGGRGLSAGFGHGTTWYAYLYTQCWAIGHYLLLTVWPAALSIDYAPHAITGARGIAGAAILAVFAAAVILAWRNVPRFGWFAFAGTFFFMLLAPSSSIVPIPGEFIAERRMYLALASVLLMAVVGAEWLRRRFAPAVAQRKLWLAFGGIAVLFAGTTAMRSHTYSRAELLWTDATQKQPGDPRAWGNLGSAFTRENPPRLAEAESAFRAAMALDSTCHFGCAQLAGVRVTQGRYADAESLLVRTLAHDTANAPVERSLALAMMKLDDFNGAIPHMRNVASRFPTEQHLLVLAISDLAVSRERDAMAAFTTAARLYPNNPEISRAASSLLGAARASDAAPHLKQLAIGILEKLQ